MGKSDIELSRIGELIIESVRCPIVLNLDHRKVEVTDLVTPAMEDGSERKFEVCIIETSQDIGSAVLQFLATELMTDIDYSTTFLILGRINGALDGSPNETNLFGNGKKQALTNYMARYCPISTILVDMKIYPNLSALATDSADPFPLNSSRGGNSFQTWFEVDPLLRVSSYM